MPIGKLQYLGHGLSVPSFVPPLSRVPSPSPLYLAGEGGLVLEPEPAEGGDAVPPPQDPGVPSIAGLETF